MIKHVGKHNQKKVVLLYREVPGEDHMCLVTYSETLPRLVHDEVMKILETPGGQQAPNLSEALFRHIMSDGRNCLEVLHRSGYIKKVPTNQVIITPNAKSSIKLDELNKLLNEMDKGKDAVKRLTEIDAEQTKQRKASANKTKSSDVAETVPDVLSDADLARQRLAQAETMRADAARLIQEAEVLTAEAKQLDPTLNDTKKKTTKAKKD